MGFRARAAQGISEEELCDLRKMLGWLKAAEKSFDFWDNPADAVYDRS